MRRQNKLIAVIVISITICNVGDLYAMEILPLRFRRKSKPVSDVAVIKGKVTDQITSMPLVNAEVSINVNGLYRRALTNGKGAYSFRLDLPRWAGIGDLWVCKAEYRTQSRTVILFAHNENTTSIDFRLRDIIKPRLQIISPAPQQEVFTNPKITIGYSDAGSGILEGSLRILFANRDLTGYTTIINDREAVCTVPLNDPMPVGTQRILVWISDRTGNRTENTLFVEVFKEDDYYLRKGKEALMERDIRAAHQYFQKAINAAEGNLEANLYYALTRLAVLPFDDAIFTLLQDMGFLGPGGEPLSKADLDLFNFKAVAPPGMRQFDLRPGFPTGQKMKKILKKKIIREMNRALLNLNLVLRKKDFVSYLTLNNSFYGRQEVEIDYADVAFLKSLILALKAEAHELLVRDLDFGPDKFSALYNQGHLTLEYILGAYPELLRVTDIPHSLRARQALVSAINSYIAGFNSMIAETDEQSNDLLTITQAPGGYKEEALLFMRQIKEIKKSLLGRPGSKFSAALSQFANLGWFFTNPPDVRRLLDRDGAVYLIEGNFLPHIDYMLANFSRAGDTYRQFLPVSDNFYSGDSGPIKEIDFADIAAAKSGLEIIKTGCFIVLGYNLQLDAPRLLIETLGGKRINFQELIDENPLLGNIADIGYLNLAGRTFSGLSESYKAASDYFLYSEDADQSDELLIPSEYFTSNAVRLQAMVLGLTGMQSTLVDPRLEVSGDEVRINPAELFLHYKEARQFLPRFNEKNQVVAGSWPDKTFGGILPDNEP